MTVAELIERLQTMPPDANVKADAGEGAWANAEEVEDCGVDNDGRRIVCVGPKR